MTAFDTHERLDLIRLVLELALPSDTPRVLDVGGAPGLLADCLGERFRTTILDQSPQPLPGYVCASGAALPFADNVFDAVTSSDVLEHVPPEARGNYLDETLRVAHDWYLLGAPFDSPAVREAERLLGEMASAVGDDMGAWIEEHQRNGLPSLNSTIAHLEQAGLACLIVPDGDLQVLVALKALERILSAIPDSGNVFETVNAWQVRFGMHRHPSTACYRHLIVAHRDSARRDALLERVVGKEIAAYLPEDTPTEPSDTAVDVRQFGEEVLKALGAAIATQQNDANALDRAELERLHRAIEAQEAQLTAQRSELDTYRGSRLVRLWRRLRGL